MNTLTENELREVIGGERTIVDVLNWMWEVQLAWKRDLSPENGY